jgi:hypothetical protein
MHLGWGEGQDGRGQVGYLRAVIDFWMLAMLGPEEEWEKYSVTIDMMAEATLKRGINFFCQEQVVRLSGNKQ